MKTPVFSFLICLFFLAASCSRSNEDVSGSQAQTQAVSSGNWRVSLFTDSGNDETTDYSGYSFSFDNGGGIMVTRNGSSKTGTWSISGSKFNIDLGPKTDVNKPFGELTDDWRIISISSTEIKLGDDNTASDEFLSFSKN